MLTRLLAASIATILVFATPAPASNIDYSEIFYNGDTNYGTIHVSNYYLSRGGEASATPLVYSWICGYAVTTNEALQQAPSQSALGPNALSGQYGEIKCKRKAGWNNRIEYAQQNAFSTCKLEDKGWGGNQISLACYKGK